MTENCPPAFQDGQLIGGWRIRGQALSWGSWAGPAGSGAEVGPSEVYRAARYAAERDGEVAELRVICPVPPSLMRERALLAWAAAAWDAEQPAEETAHPENWLEGWESGEAAYDVFAPASGQSLAQFMAAHPPLPGADAALLHAELLRALEQLHKAGFFVPQLSARNIWLGASGEVYYSFIIISKTSGAFFLQAYLIPNNKMQISRCR